jgi:L-threonylcarbamoyladenylate synthase
MDRPPLTTRRLPADPRAAREAAAVLAAGGLVAFPTETVYGLGADAANAEAVAALYRAKGRPSFNPLIAHVPSLEVARRFAVFNAEAERLAEAFWPGPLTLVLPKAPASEVSDLATAGLASLAIRVPSHAFARDLLHAFDGAVVAPSANLSGHVSPTEAAHVAADLAGRIDLIVDGGPVAVGVESAIVSCLEELTLLRPGGLARSRIEAVLGCALVDPSQDSDDVAPLAPGLLSSHYAPKTRLRLDATSVAPDEALLAFGPPLPGAKHTLNLSTAGNVDEAATRLFGYLRALDAAGARMIAAMPIPNDGLGEAINDRLRRAAAPRSP